MQNQTKHIFFFRIKRKNNPTFTLTQTVHQSNKFTIKKLNKEK